MNRIWVAGCLIASLGTATETRAQQVADGDHETSPVLGDTTDAPGVHIAVDPPPTDAPGVSIPVERGRTRAPGAWFSVPRGITEAPGVTVTPRHFNAAKTKLRAGWLERVLRTGHRSAEKQRRAMGWLDVFSGGLTTGVGVWRLVRNNERDNEFSRGLGVMLLTLGVTDITHGALSLRQQSEDEDVFERWSALDPSEETPTEVARFEGELRMLANVRRHSRRVSKWLGGARILAGALVMGLTPVPNLSSKSRRTGYIIGAVFAGTGALRLGMAVRPTRAERLWNEYERVGLSVAPQLGRGFAGLSLSGTF